MDHHHRLFERFYTPRHEDHEPPHDEWVWLLVWGSIALCYLARVGT